MRDFTSDFQAHLDRDCTSLCRAWTLTRKDGQVMGFTDHDEEISFDGVSFQPTSGFLPSDMEQSLGFSADNISVLGALSTQSITPSDIQDGLYDGANIKFWAVNWQQLEQRTLMWSGYIGEISLADGEFTAEVRGPASRFERSVGRVFSRDCDANFGDEQCGLNVANFDAGILCPKTFSACTSEFNNAKNFRGFPYLLGEDAMYSAPEQGEAKDGTSRYKT